MLKKTNINLEKISKFINKIFKLLLILCFSLVFMFISQKNSLLLYILFLIGIFYFVKKVKIKKFTIFLFSIAFIIRFISILFFETPIMSDFAVMYNTAIDILNGDMSYVINSKYLNTWGYQMGHIMYLFYLLKIFNNVIFIKIINCFVTSLVTVLIYLISREFSSERSSKIISLMYCFFPFPLLLNTVLTNQHVPALLVLLSFYLVIGKKFNNMNDILKYFLVGLLLSFSNILRPEGIVFITSLIIYLILLIKKNNIRIIVVRILVLVITYFTVFNGCSFLLTKTGYSNIGLENKNYLWKFIVGLNHETNGVYNNIDAVRYSLPGNDDVKIQVLKERIIDDFEDLPRLFLAKSTILWTKSDLSWSLHHIEGKKLEKLGISIDGSFLKDKLSSLNQHFIYFSLVLMMIGVIHINRKNINNNVNLINIVILIFFAVYLLVEVMPRYAYSPQLFVFILASIGLDSVFKYFESR